MNCKACHDPIHRRPETALCGRCWTTMQRWINDFGSTELRRGRDAAKLTPFALFGLYIAERLKSEHPDLAAGGWCFDPTPTEERRKPEPAELDAAHDSFWRDQRTALRYLRTPHRHKGGCERRGVCVKSDWQGPVLVATFAGVQIVKRLDAPMVAPAVSR